ncbi:uncharacterized protein A4U43_C04F4760 [Asparagus officinalis]|uniref:Uncharacterized protein n=1 Tax=Asparagus officinalis TaxID=4686 RepID=A0A5P1EYZ9_ASPOF|nr:uncharacterized protein A4U43_C04F4760 [Asparagus officinalis]
MVRFTRGLNERPNCQRFLSFERLVGTGPDRLFPERSRQLNRAEFERLQINEIAKSIRNWVCEIVNMKVKLNQGSELAKQRNGAIEVFEIAEVENSKMSKARDRRRNCPSHSSVNRTIVAREETCTAEADDTAVGSISQLMPSHLQQLVLVFQLARRREESSVMLFLNSIKNERSS